MAIKNQMFYFLVKFSNGSIFYMIRPTILIMNLKSVIQVGRCGLVGLFVMYKSTHGAKGPGIESPWGKNLYKMYVMSFRLNKAPIKANLKKVTYSGHVSKISIWETNNSATRPLPN